MKASLSFLKVKQKPFTALFFAMVLMLLAPAMMRGQQTLTVYDGT